jgi:hypothetical protein
MQFACIVRPEPSRQAIVDIIREMRGPIPPE